MREIKECVKEPYTRDESDRWVIKLTEEYPEHYWWAEKCEYCKLWHLYRGEK